MPSEFLSILRCPVSGQTLSLEGDARLVREDGQAAYPIENGIPVLLAGEGIFSCEAEKMTRGLAPAQKPHCGHAIPCTPSKSKT